MLDPKMAKNVKKQSFLTLKPGLTKKPQNVGAKIVSETVPLTYAQLLDPPCRGGVGEGSDDLGHFYCFFAVDPVLKFYKTH